MAVLLTVAGFIFTQHFSIEKEEHMHHAFDGIKDIVRTDGNKAVTLIKSAMENPDVIEYVSNALASKVDEVIAQRKAAAQDQMKNAVKQAEAAALQAEVMDNAFPDLDANENKSKS